MSNIWQIDFRVAQEGETFALFLREVSFGESVSCKHNEDEGEWQISLLVTEKPNLERLTEILNLASEISASPYTKPSVKMLEDKDWLAENMQQFAPFSLGSFWVYGSHSKESPPKDKIGLLVNANQAFGTGQHATTAGCLTMIEKHGLKAKRIADIGCGSGILAIAAVKLNPDAKAVALDNDKIAVKIAEENTRLNSVAERVTCIESDGYSAIKEHKAFDLITANILASPLIAMANDAAKSLAPDGVLILSGIITEHKDKVISAHEGEALALIDRIEENDWVTLAFRHKGATHDA